jgi:hypothetical protein
LDRAEFYNEENFCFVTFIAIIQRQPDVLMSYTPLPHSSPIGHREPINWPLVLLAWGVLAYTWISTWLQPMQAKPLPLISAWLQPALHVPQHTWCLFKAFTHLPCLFCGLTRSFVLIGKGEWEASLQYHLLGIPVYLLTLGVAVFGQRRVLIILGVVLSVCWFWKLGHNPRFW